MNGSSYQRELGFYESVSTLRASRAAPLRCQSGPVRREYGTVLATSGMIAPSRGLPVSRIGRGQNQPSRRLTPASPTLPNLVGGSAIPQAVLEQQDVVLPGSEMAGMTPAEDQIRELAYRKWEEAGRPAGDGVDFWLGAERDLLGETPRPASHGSFAAAG